MILTITLYFILSFCVFCGLIYEVKTRINYYEYQTEKDVLKMFCLALFWPLTWLYIVVMLSAEELAKWINKGH